ncbi:hypothetical protein DJ021_09240 [Phenylobacterium hankyongense]|uniref:DUF3597 domain-containing protein n=1 Tax=Phenylobacterium hankyongense TaxID=1813876 RepID=A0A328AYG8_9CAUL|nr:DUF3597 domain-containing protein [Phenylobacterium hankyongense]RAK59973.1 hypothetical protein DJ021_09240 [Phenylobacterium hankyongense]
MSILGSIMSKIFHPGQAHAAPAPQPAQAAAAVAQPAQQAAAQAPQQPAPVQAAEPVDVEAVLAAMASDNGQNLDWRHSIVDLMKLLSLDSGLTARKQLAGEPGYAGDTDDSATMNIWLHKQVMAKLAENGGIVPDSLR